MFGAGSIASLGPSRKARQEGRHRALWLSSESDQIIRLPPDVPIYMRRTHEEVGCRVRPNNTPSP